jgi:ribose/xylose/arabinose/galactoside ABC-type transport system permease subunit
MDLNKNSLMAQVYGGVTDFRSLVASLIDIIRGYLVPFIIALALLVFLWGVFKTVTAGADGKKRQEGIAFITYGIIGLAVMISVWSLVYLLTSTFFSGGLLIPQLN